MVRRPRIIGGRQFNPDVDGEYGSQGARVGRITTVGISDTIRSDLGLKGGGLPDFVLPEVAAVDFVYLLNPNITVTTTSPIPVRQNLTLTASGVSADQTSASITPNDGNNAWFFIVDLSAYAGVGNVDAYIQGSPDGTNWGNLANISGMGGVAVYSWLVNGNTLTDRNVPVCLPPYLRIFMDIPATATVSFSATLSLGVGDTQ